MNCPKCGSYVEEGKTYCFMCGTKLGNTDFSSPGRVDQNPSLNEDYYRKKEEYKNRLNNYRDVKIERVENEKKDLFDIYSEHKTLIKICFFLVVVVIGIIIAYSIAKKNNRTVELKPVIGNLYYEVDSNLKQSKSSDNSKEYNLSESTGTTCSILVSATSSSSGDYVKLLFNALEEKYISNLKYNANMELENPTEVPLFTTDAFQINGTIWNYLYVFYQSDNHDNKYTFLKYRHLSVGYKEKFYDITLFNNENTEKCNLYLDSMIRSLQFITAE